MPSGQDPDKEPTVAGSFEELAVMINKQAISTANAMYDESIAILDSIDEPRFTDKQARINYVKDTLNAMKQLING